MWRPRSDIGRLQYRDVILKQGETTTSIRIHARKPKEGQVKSMTLRTVEDKDICTMRTTYEFILKTTVIRQTLPEDHRFFLTYLESAKKQPTSVRSTTTANWIKTAMDKAGIGTNHYQAHSIRAASSTKAVELGHSVGNVKDHTDWSLNSKSFPHNHPPVQLLPIQFFLVLKSVSRWSQLEFV